MRWGFRAYGSPAFARSCAVTDAAVASRRVLIMVNEVFDTAGGNLRAAVNVAEALARHGDDVTFSAPWVAADSHATVDALDPGVARKLFRASRPLARFGGSVRQFAWLARNVRCFDQVQVHSLFHLSAVYAIVMCAVTDVPVLLWPHGTIDPFDLRKHASVKRWIGPVITRRLLDRCAALVFTTELESQVAVTYGASVRHEVVPLPVKPLVSGSAQGIAFRAKWTIPYGASVVLFLGRLNYKKGLPLLIESVARLADMNVCLVIAGDGESEQVRLVRESGRLYGLADRMRMTGWLEGDERLAAYAAANVFALLSDAENFGLALVEALSAGLPAVVSDQVSIADDLARAGAALVVPRAADAAAAALAQVLMDPVTAAAMGARGRAHVQAHFAPASVAKQLRRLLDAGSPGGASS